MASLWGSLTRQRGGSERKPPRRAPLSSFAGEWPLTARLEPRRVSVFGEVVRAQNTNKAFLWPAFVVDARDTLSSLHAADAAAV